jgi:septal ring factor EnvC (AmiA/AmiB activator)
MALLFAAAIAFASPGVAQQSATELARIAADRLDAAQASLLAADTARNRVDALTRTIRAYEQGLAAVREGLRQARLRESAILSEFQGKSAELSRLLGVMIAVQDNQGPLALMHPQGPIGSARTGMIAGAIAPAISAEADHLRARLEELQALGRIQDTAASQLQIGLTGAQTARAELSQAMSDRTDLPKRFVADETAMNLLARNAETLGDFASGLLEMTPLDAETDAVLSFSDARGSLPFPVSGQVLRRYQEADAAGIVRPGLIVATRPGALVQSPWAATVRYAGPLLDYGNVIILEPEADSLLVLAGPATLYVVAGQVVASNEAVGLMGGVVSVPGDELPQSSANTGLARSETLYIELRKNAEPIDPAPWFTETKEETQ